MTWAQEEPGQRASRRQLALTLLWNLAVHSGSRRRLRGGRPGPGGRCGATAAGGLAALDGARVQSVAAELTSHRGGQYARRCRGLLAQALLRAGRRDLAQSVQPTLRPTRGDTLRLCAERSQEAHFDLHDCIPLVARAQGVQSLDYRLVRALGEQLVPCLRSVSKLPLRRSLGFLFSVLRPCWEPEDAWHRAWARLRALDADRLLDLYAAQHLNRTTVAVATFRRQIYLLRLAHLRILQPGTRHPIPLAGFAAGPWHGAGSDSGAEDGTLDDTERDVALRRRVADLRVQRCRPSSNDAADDGEAVFSFSTDEVERILRACCTTREQLVVLLLMTTGLRLGGLCRLRLPATLAASAAADPARVPTQMATTEKNGRGRTVWLTAACRILIA